VFLYLPAAGHQEPNMMNGMYLPTELIVSFFLAVLALALNLFSPGAAAILGAIAAVIFIKLLILGR